MDRSVNILVCGALILLCYIIASIRHETGVEIAGIISLPQMRLYGVEIDTDDNFIRI